MKLEDILLVALGFALAAILLRPTSSEPLSDAPAIAAADTLSEWQILQLSIAMTESMFNPDARGPSDDLGVLQITPIYAREASRLNKDRDYSHSEALDPSKAVEMFNVVQDHHNPTHNIDKAIKVHNPRGDAIGYSTKVKRNSTFIKQYENIRTVVKDYELRKSI